MTAVEPRLVRAGSCELGEGPLWHETRGELLYVDILGGDLHAYSPSTGRHSTRALGGRPSFVVPADDGSLIVGRDRDIVFLREGGLGETLVALDEPAHNRINDGAVDVFGRLWFGTMDLDETRPTGALYCLEGNVLRRTTATAVVTNGPAISADGRTVYFVDSVQRTVWRYAVGPRATLLEETPFVRLRDNDGLPDGVTLDTEGCLWVALWGGGGVRRYAPDGRLLLHVPLPCDRVTKLAFGGRDLRTAFVTTACAGLDDAARTRQPAAGGLFAFEAPAPGRVSPRFKVARPAPGN
jgi:D-xylonolactonase